MSEVFSLKTDRIALPEGAFAGTHRQTLYFGEKAVLSLNQGKRRAYVFPLFTPRGFAVTSEAPADHPHHNSLWFASDHLHLRMPTGNGEYEEYTYNFYIDETFQGRAPGTVMVTATRAHPVPNGITLVQDLEWRGPVEWAAPCGRCVAFETRSIHVSAGIGSYTLDVESRLSAGEWDFSVGPTRHAYFNVRVAESMTTVHGGRLQDDRGRTASEEIMATAARWVDFSGPVGGGHLAGISVFPDPRDHEDLSWFIADWGVVTVGPFRRKRQIVRRGEELVARYRVVVHDGDAHACDPAEQYAMYLADVGVA